MTMDSLSLREGGIEGAREGGMEEGEGGREGEGAREGRWMIHPNVFVFAFNFINFLLGCSSVIYD